MKLWMVGSGSEGNAVLVECDGTRILIDAGFGPRTLAGRLRSIGVEPESIDACLVTHDHADHVKGAGACARRWGWGLFSTPGTARAPEMGGTRVQTFEPGETIDFPRMKVETALTPHDAVQSVGFVVTSRTTGARAGIFYDLGHMSEAVTRACQSLDILVLESNHDDDMLRNGPYPWFLQRRIASRYGHLSNRAACNFARQYAQRGLQHLVLAHLSVDNNTPDVAVSSMRAALAKTRSKAAITPAQQDSVVGPFTPHASKTEPPLQYALF